MLYKFEVIILVFVIYTNRQSKQFVCDLFFKILNHQLQHIYDFIQVSNGIPNYWHSQTFKMTIVSTVETWINNSEFDKMVNISTIMTNNNPNTKWYHQLGFFISIIVKISITNIVLIAPLHLYV